MHIHEDFKTIGYKHHTDKVTHHGYHRTYPIFLEHLRKETFSMLEIGIDRQGSLGLWAEYFPEAKIFALDIKDNPPYPGITIFKADQSKTSDLKKVGAQIPGKLKLIIDDGSHVPDHQLTSLNALWDKLEEGGIYIIEDIETSYWQNAALYGYTFSAGRRSDRSIVNQLKKVIHIINKEFCNIKEQQYRSKIAPHVLQDIESVTFCYNAIILVKKRSAWKQYYEREYRFKRFIHSL